MLSAVARKPRLVSRDRDAKPVVLPSALAKRNPLKELQFAVGRRCASAPRIPPSDCEFTVMQKRSFFCPATRHESENVTLLPPLLRAIVT